MLKLKVFFALMLITFSVSFNFNKRCANGSEINNNTDRFESNGNGLSISIVSPFNLVDFKSAIEAEIDDPVTETSDYDVTDKYVISSVPSADDELVKTEKNDLKIVSTSSPMMNIRPVSVETHIMRIALNKYGDKKQKNLDREARNVENDYEEVNTTPEVDEIREERLAIPSSYNKYTVITNKNDTAKLQFIPIDQNKFTNHSRQNDSIIQENDNVIVITNKNDTAKLQFVTIDQNKFTNHSRQNDSIVQENDNVIVITNKNDTAKLQFETIDQNKFTNHSRQSSQGNDNVIDTSETPLIESSTDELTLYNLNDSDLKFGEITTDQINIKNTSEDKPSQSFNINAPSVVDFENTTSHLSVNTLMGPYYKHEYTNLSEENLNTDQLYDDINLTTTIPDFNQTDYENNTDHTEHVVINQSILNPETWYWRQSFIIACIVTSVPFLAVTLMVFWILPQLNQSDHGKSIMCYLLSVMIGYAVLAVTLAYGQSLGAMCVPLGYVLHYCIVAISSWLNIMCLDILWAFSVLENRTEAPSRFKHYSLYAWTLPLIIVTITFALSYAPLPVQYKPVVGGDLCFLESETTQWIYCHGPVLVLTTANVIMFITTAIVILVCTKKTSILSSPNSARSRAQRRWFRLYTKLFIVMGMNWVVELLSLVLDYNNVSVLFLITDTTNGLLGVIIFSIYVCRQRVYKQLKRWWNGEDMIAGRRRSAFASTLTRFRENLLRSKFGSGILGFKESEKNP